MPDTANEWRDKSEELRREILDRVVFRGVPTEWFEGEPRIVWSDVIETGKGYLIRKLRYEALPGLWIPAQLESSSLKWGVTAGYWPASLGPTWPGVGA